MYDRAIASDLSYSFNSTNSENPVVKVIDPESAVNVVAQIKNDEMTYPAVILTRDPDTPVDTNRTNFTRIHRGQVSVLDKETNNLYFERTIPIDLKYALTIITTNVVDMDEIVKELLFKYTSMYFITMQLPYESNRQIRFGVTIDSNAGIQRKSSTHEYLSEGKLHQTIIPLKCEGCVLISYTPQKVTQFVYDREISLKEYNNV